MFYIHFYLQADAEFYQHSTRTKTVFQRLISAKMVYVFRCGQNRDISGCYMGGKRAFFQIDQKIMILFDFSRNYAEINGTIRNLMRIGSYE